MSTNPFLNALAATAYIAAVASVLYYAPKTIAPVSGVIVPVAVLSLFVLSAAMMGYFFLYQPVRLFFENKHQEATKLFLATAAISKGQAVVLGAAGYVTLATSATGVIGKAKADVVTAKRAWKWYRPHYRVAV